MATTDPFGLEASGIPPEMAAEYRGLTRQQAIAEAMMKRGMEPPQGPINAGKYLVRRSPWEGVASIANTLLGQYMASKTDSRMSELGKQYQDKNNADMAEFVRARQPKTETRAPDPFEYDQMGEETPEPTPSTRTVPGNTRQALADLMMKNPGLARHPMVAFEMQQMNKAPTSVGLGGHTLLINPDGTERMITNTETEASRQNRLSLERREAEKLQFARDRFNTLSAEQKQKVIESARKFGLSVDAYMLKAMDYNLDAMKFADTTGGQAPMAPTKPPSLAGGNASPAALPPANGAVNAPTQGGAFPRVTPDVQAGRDAQASALKRQELAAVERDIASGNLSPSDLRTANTVRDALVRELGAAAQTLPNAAPAPVGGDMPSFPDVIGGISQPSQSSASQAPKTLDQRIADATAGVSAPAERRAIERRVRVDAAKGDASSKPIPATSLKMQQESLDAIGTAATIGADLRAINSLIDSGKLELGPITNVASQARNVLGQSNESSRNYASFKATLEKLRNDSLRLNKGVQTEGDSQRAWNEILTNINDTKYVKQRLTEVQKINERAIELHQMNLNAVRDNYGKPTFDTTQFRIQQPVVGGPQIGEKRNINGVPAKWDGRGWIRE